MADMKIADAPAVTSVGGGEILPASVSGAAKSLTTAQIKDYVLAAAAAVAGITEPSPDANFIMSLGTQQGEVLRQLSPQLVADEVASILFDNTSQSELAAGDLIIIETGDSEGYPVRRVTCIGDISAFVRAQIDPLNIHGLTATDPVDVQDEVPVYDASVAANRKATVAQLAASVNPLVPGNATTSSEAVASDDYLLVGKAPTTAGGAVTLAKVTLAQSGIATSNKVVAPAANTANYIPQWNGANSKTLKNGLEKVGTSVDGNVTHSNISAYSTNDQLPTAASVYRYGLEATAQRAVAPSANTADYIPQWDGANSKTLKNGLALQTAVRSAQTASDSAVPTEKAVRDQLDAIPSNPATFTFDTQKIATAGEDNVIVISGMETGVRRGELVVCRYGVGNVGLFINVGNEQQSVWYLATLQSSLPSA